MRIRIFSAFASNNSGSYTIVGRFADEATAAEVARIAREASDAHDAWHSVNEWDDAGPAPLDDFVRAHGLREARHGRGDEWPCHGAKPSAVAVGRQVMVHAPYTVTLPPVFGELFYAMGGRVEVELDHAHDPIAVEFAWYPKDMSYGDPRIEPALAAGRWVVCDRFSDATFAYQVGGRGLDRAKFDALEAWVHPGLQPDLTLVFDLDPALAAARVASTGVDPDRFEREQRDFFERVRAAYLERARLAPLRICVIDAARSPEAIRAAIERVVRERFFS